VNEIAAMAEKRKAPRIDVTMRAALIKGTTTYACLVQNVSTSGIYMVCGSPFVPCDVLTCRFEVDNRELIEAVVQVKHCDDFGIGVEIRQMSEKAASLYSRFLEGFYSERLA
jgi:hypothetical protein